MGRRIALQQHTVLQVQNAVFGKLCFEIEKEVGRGGSSIVYDGFFQNNAGQKRKVRVKECYPFQVRITRSEDGNLTIYEEEQEKFNQYKKRFKESFEIMNQISESSALTNSTVYSLDLYEANHTLYIVTTYMEGHTLKANANVDLQTQIQIIRTIAKTIGKLHEQGYLYLDLKPDNVFVLNEVTDLIQLFDFDSMLKIGEDFRISYTEGFSALELKQGDFRRIGKQADVFSLGAMVYYLLFGITPDTFACANTGSYDYETTLYSDIVYPDHLYDLLNEFFHHTLAPYYVDRYLDMAEAEEALEQIEYYADPNAAYIITPPVQNYVNLVGRQMEWETIQAFCSEQTSSDQILCVTGMGGIGKSTLVKDYLSKTGQDFDQVIYLYQNGPLLNVFADDEQIRINGMNQSEGESAESYASRKLVILSYLIRNTKTILVIDDFHFNESDDLAPIIRLPWKIILITREHLEGFADQILSVEEMKRNDLYELLERNMNRGISERERVFADQLIENVNGHTLLIELIGKQISRGFLTLQEGAELSKRRGFANIAAEKVRMEANHKHSYQTVHEVIGALYDRGMFSESEVTLLKMLTLFKQPGIEVGLFQELTELDTKDMINILFDKGMIQIHQNYITLHPLIDQCIADWSWEADSLLMVKNVIRNLREAIGDNGYKEEFPSNLYKKEKTKKSKSGVLQSIERDREQSHRLERYKNIEELFLYLKYAREILEECKKIPRMMELKECKELLYLALYNTPEDESYYLFENVDYVLNGDYEKTDPVALMKLCDYTAHLYENAEDFDAAAEYIEKAEDISMEEHQEDPHYLRGLVHEMAWDYYDFMLNGEYDVDTNKYLKLFFQCMDSAINHMKKSKHENSKITLARYLLSKSIILIRYNPKKKLKIRKALKDAEKAIWKYTDEDSDNRSAYFMALGWYYTYVEPDADQVVDCIEQAFDLAKNENISAVAWIDDLLSPAANMLLELADLEPSYIFLQTAVQICEECPGEIIFIRKKREILEHMFDLIPNIEDEEMTEDFISHIRDYNEECELFGLEPLEYEPFQG